jgi:hypothetical protein
MATIKTGHLTQQDAQNTNQAHYAAEDRIMGNVRQMTLAGKQKLADNMAQHCADAEDSAKS